MDSGETRAIEAFVGWVGEGREFGQIRIDRREVGHEVRHAADSAMADSNLREVGIDGLRAVARHAVSGAFRPLKGAPTLGSGWRCRLPTAEALERALEQLYPGGLADWFAVLRGTARPTGFDRFAARQTGIYSAVKSLDAATVGDVVRVGCDARYCVKRRLWPAAGVPGDGDGKSDVPCLEPCAVMLEFARRVARLSVGPPRTLVLEDSGDEGVLAALENAAQASAEPGPVGDAAIAPDATPRFRLLPGKHRRQVGPVAPREAA